MCIRDSGKLTVTSQFATQFVMVPTASAAARMRGGNISPSSTHSTTPHEAAKNSTNALAEISATTPQLGGSTASSPTTCAKLNAQPVTASEIAMPMEPMTSSGFRPILSTSAMAMNVPMMFTIEVNRLSSSELLSSMPVSYTHLTLPTNREV